MDCCSHLSLASAQMEMTLMEIYHSSNIELVIFGVSYGVCLRGLSHLAFRSDPNAIHYVKNPKDRNSKVQIVIFVKIHLRICKICPPWGLLNKHNSHAPYATLRNDKSIVAYLLTLPICNDSRNNKVNMKAKSCHAFGDEGIHLRLYWNIFTVLWQDVLLVLF